MVFLRLNAKRFRLGLLYCRQYHTTWIASADKVSLDNLQHPELITPVQPENPKCVKVAVVGLPNAGKSTLVNRIVGKKISAVSPKVQTTRNRILAILTKENTQIILFDTPGLVSYHEARRLRLSKPLVKEAKTSTWDADVILTIIDGALFRKGVNKVPIPKLYGLEEAVAKKHNLVAVNKKDMLPRNAGLLEHVLLKTMDEETLKSQFEWGMYISAKTGEGVEELVTKLKDLAPAGDWLYDSQVATDMNLENRIEETIRELLFLRLHQELPYTVFQKTETIEEDEEGNLMVSQSLITKSESQKRMIIGKGGKVIRGIESEAQEILQESLGVSLILHLTVKQASKNEIIAKQL